MKKQYERPALATRGDIRRITEGDGIQGDADQLLWFRYGVS